MKDIKIFTDKIRSKNDRFWGAAGTDELFPFAYTDEGQRLMKRIAGYGAKYVRNHYTLNKQTRYGIRVGGDVYDEDENGQPIYDFEWINGAFENIVKCGLKPIVELDFSGLKDGSYNLKIYTMDGTHNNTYRLWQRLGSPDEPTDDELCRLHAEQEITSDFETTVEVSGGRLVYDIVLSTMSAKLVRIGRK